MVFDQWERAAGWLWHAVSPLPRYTAMHSSRASRNNISPPLASNVLILQSREAMNIHSSHSTRHTSTTMATLYSLLALATLMSHATAGISTSHSPIPIQPPPTPHHLH